MVKISRNVRHQELASGLGADSLPANLAKVLDSFPESLSRDVLAFRGYYALGDQEPLTLKEIGEELNVSRQVAKRMVGRVWLMLKRRMYLEANPLNPQDINLHERSIFDLMLSVRSRQALMGDSIETIGDLMKCSVIRLLIIPNLGKKSVAEIQAALKALGLELIDE